MATSKKYGYPVPTLDKWRKHGCVWLGRKTEPMQLCVREDGKIGFKFKFAPWKDVIEFFAKQAGYSLTADAYPNGTFSYTDTKTYTLAGNTVGPFNNAYRRHVYSGLVRIMNVAGRRDTP